MVLLFVGVACSTVRSVVTSSKRRAICITFMPRCQLSIATFYYKIKGFVFCNHNFIDFFCLFQFPNTQSMFRHGVGVFRNVSSLIFRLFLYLIQKMPK